MGKILRRSALVVFCYLSFFWFLVLLHIILLVVTIIIIVIYIIYHIITFPYNCLFHSFR